MSGREDSNKVSQSNITVENGDVAGRDIFKNTYNQHGNIINVYLSGSQDYKSYIDILHQITSASEEFIRAIIKKEDREKYGNEQLEKSLSLIEVASKTSLFSDSFSGINGEYEDIVLGKNKNDLDEEYLKDIIKATAVCVAKLEFDKAHRLLEDALGKMKPSDSHYNVVYKEYLITGFIHYSRQNNMDGLRSLLRKTRTNVQDIAIDHVIGNIFQEVCTRDTDIARLENSAVILERIYATAPKEIKPSMANSLGLAYRRVGERTNVECLKKAVKILKDGLALNDTDRTMEIQLKDNLAICLVRIFEFTKKEEYLNEAKELLDDCLKILDTITDPRDCMLKPRVLNNIGNTYKQGVLCYGNIIDARKAIAYYEEAEKFWTEKDSGYEWGLLKKNIGETKFALGQVTNDMQLLVEALEECMASMKYRDIQNSPYQWAKSAEIIFSIVLSLHDHNSSGRIDPSARKKIIGYTKIIDAHSDKWSPNNFHNFKENAQKAYDFLTHKKRFKKLPHRAVKIASTPQEVYWGVNQGLAAGAVIVSEKGVKKFKPWNAFKKELEQRVISVFPQRIPVGSTVKKEDFYEKKDWVVYIYNPQGIKIGSVWVGGNPENGWHQDGLVRTGLVITDNEWVVWQVFQRYSDGSYKLIKMYH